MAYSGSDNEEAMSRCPQCKGYGEVENSHGDMVLCSVCSGSGMVSMARKVQYESRGQSPQQKQASKDRERAADSRYYPR